MNNHLFVILFIRHGFASLFSKKKLKFENPRAEAEPRTIANHAKGLKPVHFDCVYLACFAVVISAVRVIGGELYLVVFSSDEPVRFQRGSQSFSLLRDKTTLVARPTI